MSLLQNEDFTIWHLRTSYLTSIKDGVGDRLININSSILNTPTFRAAGWSSYPQHGTGTSASQSGDGMMMSHSPPIPTAVTSEYFNSSKVPSRHASTAARGMAGAGDDGVVFGGNAAAAGFAGPNAGRSFLGFAGDGEDDAGGMVTGGGSGETIGPGPVQKRRRRKEQVDEDDSSDLSDESDEEGEGQRAAQQIKFKKMPVRTRSGSSPIRSVGRSEGPEVMVTSPSRPSASNRLRAGSLGAAEVLKTRARRDTTTSSDMSSENELDPSVFKRRQVRITARRSEEETQQLEAVAEGGHDENEDDDDDDDGLSGDESVGSASSSEFGETVESTSILDRVQVSGSLSSSSPVMLHIPPPSASQSSPKKPKPQQASLQKLPPPRPISLVQPISLLGSALKARKAAPANPVERFATLYGKASTNALQIKIYAPFSDSPDEPFDCPMERDSKESGLPTQSTVAEAIGLALWRYAEEKLKPAIPPEKLTVNRWTLRMIEDGEVEYDFPALSRTRSMVDFTSNNNKPPRGRSRGKSYDEFALVEATDAEFAENEKNFPQYSVATAVETEEASDAATPTIIAPQPLAPKPALNRPVLGQPFPSALGNSTLTPADAPAPTSHATPRLGVSKTIVIRFVDSEASSQKMSMEIATDSYIAEILDFVCKRWGFDKANFNLRVTGSNTVAPLDRTVEALGDRTELDLVRRRFGAGPFHLTGSPGSSSPNAPLMIDMNNPVTNKKGKKGPSGASSAYNLANTPFTSSLGGQGLTSGIGAGGKMLHPLAQQVDYSNLGPYKRYAVIRKQSMSFTSSSQRILLFDRDFILIMPADPANAKSNFFDSTAGYINHNHSSGKTTSIAYSDVVGSKVSRRHPKMFRIVVLRQGDLNEQKRYDFEARSVDEAREIVEEVCKGMVPFGDR